VPKLVVVQNYCANHGAALRTAGFADTIAGYKEYARDNVRDETDDRKVYNCGCDVHADEINDGVPNHFRFLFTCPWMLKLWEKANVRAMDGTYKLNAKGFPVLAFGIVDADQKFHLCAIAVCLSEKEEDFRWCLERLEDEVEAGAYTRSLFSST